MHLNRYVGMPMRLLLAVLFFLPLLAQAQDDGGFVVKKWRPDTLGPAAEKFLLIGIGSGYGFSTWKHQVKGVHQYAGSDVLLFPVFPDGGGGYANLAQNTDLQTFDGVADPSLGVTEKTTVNYKGKGGTIPINLDILYNIGKFRIGATVGYEFYRVKKLEFDKGTYQMREIELTGKRSLLKYGLQAEFMAVDLDSWRFGVQAKGGMFHMFGNIDKDLSKKGRFVFGGGPIVEKPLGSAFIAYAAPTYEYRSYRSDGLPDEVEAANTFGTLFMNVGIRARLDNLFAKHPLCPIPSCHVRKVHRHNKGLYRGQRWWQKQNPRVGENLPNEKVDKKGRHSVKKPYIVKDPKKQAAKAEKRQAKALKAQEKGKTLKTGDNKSSLAPEDQGKGIEKAAEQPQSKKERKKKKKKGSGTPPPPAVDPDDED